MVTKRNIETRRFLLLLDQLAADPEIGSLQAAAKKLGVHPSYGVKLRSESHRSVGLDALKRAESVLGLPRSFFTDPSLGDAPDWRASAEGRAGPAEPAHWAEFVANYPRINELTADQLQDVKAFAARRLRRRSWLKLAFFADLVLDDEPSEIFESKRGVE